MKHKTLLKKLLEKIEAKNSWGKNELKVLILEILASVDDESEGE